MIIDSITLENTLIFGPRQSLKNLKPFNLLIGKNGSGKSNLLRILRMSEIDFVPRDTPNKTQEEVLKNGMPLFTVRLSHEMQCNRRSAICTTFWGDIDIRYRGEWSMDASHDPYVADWTKYGISTPHSLIFRDGELVSGNVMDFQVLSTVINTDLDDSEFSSLFPEPDWPWWGRIMAELNFGLEYIFERKFFVQKTGQYADHNRLDSKGIIKGAEGVGYAKFEREKWPSGVLQCAKLILQFQKSSSTILVDEPELHLEPRIVGRLFQFLSWLCFSQSHQFKENPAIKGIGSSWKCWIEKNGYAYDDDKKSIATQPGAQQKQIFVASHSAVLIQEFLNFEELASIHAFDLQWMDNSFDPNKPFKGGGYTAEQKTAGYSKQTTLYSSIRRIDTGIHSILDNLGCKGSDILQCNGVVWVEGPSDVIYVKKWLEMYALENGSTPFIQSFHYEFQMYGGAILDSLFISLDGILEDEYLKKLVSMFSFSRNAYVIIDSDAKKYNDIVYDDSNFSKAKVFISEQLECLREDGYNVGTWYDPLNTNENTIEEYLDDESRKISPSLTKKIAAIKRTEKWGSEKRLSDFPDKLKPEIAGLFNMIEVWNR